DAIAQKRLPALVLLRNFAVAAACAALFVQLASADEKNARRSNHRDEPDRIEHPRLSERTDQSDSYEGGCDVPSMVPALVFTQHPAKGRMPYKRQSQCAEQRGKKLCATPDAKSNESIHGNVRGTSGSSTKHNPVTMHAPAKSIRRAVIL